MVERSCRAERNRKWRHTVGRGGRFISGRGGCDCLNDNPAGCESCRGLGICWQWKHVGVCAAASRANEVWIDHQATTLISKSPFTNVMATEGHFQLKLGHGSDRRMRRWSCPLMHLPRRLEVPLPHPSMAMSRCGASCTQLIRALTAAPCS